MLFTVQLLPYYLQKLTEVGLSIIITITISQSGFELTELCGGIETVEQHSLYLNSETVQ